MTTLVYRPHFVENHIAYQHEINEHFQGGLVDMMLSTNPPQVDLNAPKPRARPEPEFESELESESETKLEFLTHEEPDLFTSLSELQEQRPQIQSVGFQVVEFFGNANVVNIFSPKWMYHCGVQITIQYIETSITDDQEETILPQFRNFYPFKVVLLLELLPELLPELWNFCRKILKLDYHRLYMGFSWAILLYVMADVMGLGHGGDGAEDPPPPVGFGRGQHEQDAELPKKRRGLAKNIQLSKIIRANKGKPDVEPDSDEAVVSSGEVFVYSGESVVEQVKSLETPVAPKLTWDFFDEFDGD
ncbi:unnamed protein product [Lactuca saligna]|uniref:Uncharacterized protein n=1 Tax=Lactuca saligna TaxID=75948 RepID=A0AA35Z7L7_LACSI|nr:unnamed protein product [Lactuca saligna]